jgi:hypothetical protein
MKNFWKYFNIVILALQFIICLIGTFYKHISFGWGLGDLLGYGLMYLFFITHLILTLKVNSSYSILSLIFTFTTLLICLQATFMRGHEYPWNGNLFYK